MKSGQTKGMDTMKIKEIGHLAFTCKDLAESMKFYGEKMGCIHKFNITYGEFLEHLQSKNAADAATVARLSAIADKIWIAYYDLGNGQFVELFDPGAATIPCIPGSEHLNYSHVALLVEDIHEAHEELKAKGIPVDTPPSLGLEGTWQMWSHDPDGNKIEFMQYTENSWQLTGH